MQLVLIICINLGEVFLVKGFDESLWKIDKPLSLFASTAIEEPVAVKVKTEKELEEERKKVCSLHLLKISFCPFICIKVNWNSLVGAQLVF